jgi:hypothetical protein
MKVKMCEESDKKKIIINKLQNIKKNYNKNEINRENSLKNKEEKKKLNSLQVQLRQE